MNSAELAKSPGLLEATLQEKEHWTEIIEPRSSLLEFGFNAVWRRF